MACISVLLCGLHVGAIRGVLGDPMCGLHIHAVRGVLVRTMHGISMLCAASLSATRRLLITTLVVAYFLTDWHPSGPVLGSAAVLKEHVCMVGPSHDGTHGYSPWCCRLGCCLHNPLERECGSRRGGTVRRVSGGRRSLPNIHPTSCHGSCQSRATFVRAADSSDGVQRFGRYVPIGRQRSPQAFPSR